MGERERGSALAGKTIFVSRAQEQAVALCREIELRGGKALLQPLLRFALPKELAAFDSALRKLSEFDWWLVTSQNALDFAKLRGEQIGVDLATATSSVKIGAVGESTAQRAIELGLKVAYIAQEHRGLALVEELAAKLEKKRVLMLRSNLVDAGLSAVIERYGAKVTDIIAYETLPISDSEKKDVASLPWDQVDAALFFSPSAVRRFADAVGTERWKANYSHVILGAIGPVTADAIRDLELGPVLQASDASVAAILDTLEIFFTNSPAAEKAGAKHG